MRPWQVSLQVLTVAAAMLVLAACAGDKPSASRVPSVAPAPADSAPSTSATPAPVSFTIPTDCRKLVDASTYTSTFGSMPLNATGVVEPGETGAVEPQTPPAGASVEVMLKSAIQLRCVWRDPAADITYLEATVATVDPAVASSYFTTLAAQGYVCKQANGGRQCQLVTKNNQYPVDDARTALLRDTVFIVVAQSNFKTSNLMGSIATTIFD